MSSLLRHSLVLLLTSLSLVASEIRDFRVILEPDSTVVHYSEGYLIAPGYIDLSDLKFATTLETEFIPLDTDDANYPDEVDDDKAGGEGGGAAAPADGPAAPAGGKDGGGRDLRALAGPGVTQLDIAVLHLPGDCANTRTGCDWVDFGVGARSATGEDVRWCCSNDAVELGLCEGGPKYGSLIINTTLFTGSHRYVEIPPTGEISDEIRYGKIEEPDQSGRYVVIFANCNDEGREVLVSGATVWKSKHGYLPGELFEFMHFYVFVAVIYFALMAAYAFSMNKYSEARIDLEKWILGTMIMGLLETFFRTASFFVWNVDGTRLMFAVYIGMLSRILFSCPLLFVFLTIFLHNNSPRFVRCIYGSCKMRYLTVSPCYGEPGMGSCSRLPWRHVAQDHCTWHFLCRYFLCHRIYDRYCN